MKTIFRQLVAVFTTSTNQRHTRRSKLRTRGMLSLRFMLATFTILTATVSGIFLFTKLAQAATYNFTQSSYVGGATAATAVHPTNATGWTQYSSASTTVSAGAGGISLNSQEAVKMIKFAKSQAANNKIRMISTTTAFVANDSSVYRTDDGGTTYVQLMFPPNGNAYGVNDLAVVDTQNIYASTYSHLFKTADGGTTWTDVLAGSNNMGLSFVNATTGWVVRYTSAYQILKTTDGGSTWATQISTSTAINNIQFIDVNNGWAVGSNGTALKTTDGGTTWTQTNLGTTYAVNKVKFISTTTGWIESADAVGWGRVISKTTDGGTTWTSQTIPTALSITDLYATDANTIWLVGNSNYYGYIYKSSDGGTTFTQQFTQYGSNLNSISGINANTITAADALMGPILTTTNGGTTWNSKTAVSGYRFVTTPSFLYLGGYKSTDGGATWTLVGSSPESTLPYYSGSFFINATTGWVINNSSYGISKTTDGGATWVTQTMPVSVPYLRSVSFADVNNGWAVGLTGMIIHTSDGGTTWVQQGAGMTTQNFNKVIALSSTNALLFDSYGYVRRTTDGGATWTGVQAAAANEPIYNASFIDANTGWIAAGNYSNLLGHIYKTTDGGVTWTASYSGIYQVNDVLFTDANNGYALANSWSAYGDNNGPRLLITRDGGATWVNKSSIAPTNFTNSVVSNSTSCGDLGYNASGVFFACSYMIGSNNPISHIFKISTSYPTGGYLISSPYNTGSAANILSKITWTGTTPAGTNIQFQVRTAPDSAGSPGVWTAWMGPDGTSATYFTDSTGATQAIPAALKDGVNDQWIQYQATLTSNGTVAPSVSSVTMQYVVNATPQFDGTYGTNGVTVSQVATSTDPNWGKVVIGYSVRDPDTTSGNVTPGFITPSFEYSLDGGTSWSAVPAGALSATDTANKSVSQTGYTIYTATWAATSTIASVYNANVKVRVTANDNEAANNIAKAISGVFTLDTKTPIVTSGIDSSVASSTTNITMTATDDSQLQYRLCNDAAFPTSDAQGNSCAWSTLGANMASTTRTWTPVAATTTPATETAYLQVRDALGNVASQTLIAPATPTNFDFKDISNIGINVYREFLSWALFQNSTGSTFGGYNLYSSTDGTNYSLLSNITNLQTNFYVDNISTATSSMHYYKVSAYDTNGNKSHFTPVLSDIPNGTGGTDVTPPTITNIAVPPANIKNTTAQITFTTDKLTQATVQYRVSGTTPWSTYSNISYLKDQSVYITGLMPNTLYNLQVKAVDVYGNTSQIVAGPDFTTAGGPVITNVTVSSLTDISATIFWNTSTSSDSYVYYSQFASMTNPGTAGSASLVSCVGSVCQHQVTISGLTAGVQYYYYVKSTDGLGNATTDTNINNYYNFVTTLDTTPPVISGISTPVVAAKSAVIVWKTDEPSTSQVLYGTSTGDRSKFTVTDMTKSIYHVVTLSVETINAGAAGGMNELTPVSTYYYVVKSADVAGNTATSPEQTLTTPNTGDVTIVAVSVVNTGLGAGQTNNPVPDTTPPTISDIKATNIDSFDESISFTTNENTVSFVDYGKDTSYGNSVGDSNLTSSHASKLINLTMGTTYHYRVKAIDAAGNSTTSDDQTFRTPFLSEQQSTSTVPLDDATLLQSKIEDLVQSALPSLTAPFVTAPVITGITEHEAKITFTSNVKAYGLVNYATDDEYIVASSTDAYTAELSTGSGRETTHTVTLKNLKSNTKYHLQAKAYVFQDVVGKSDDITFLTKPSQIQGSIAERTKSSFTVVWTTDEPASSIIEYKNIETGGIERSVDQPLRTAHSMKIDNLPSGTKYEVTISGVNKTGNILEAVAPLTVFVPRDLVPPVISGFKVDGTLVPGRTDRIQTVVSWKTDKIADSTVYYEEGTGTPGDTKELANKVGSSGVYVQTHSVILANLKPGTIYRIKVVSVDDSGNRASFGPRTIITPQQTQSITDIIFKNFEDSFKFLRQL